ncbi:hypothetical protein FS749_010833 [Ceratobasidium sp. UAMH 11750]|nr:hypothetical protein FS749_010833 [Ceratobasidium sp. UAMH 11750]
MIQFMNDNNPFNNVEFYGPAYPNFYRYGVRYGSDKHYRGRKSRYGYIYNRRPVLIKRIYQSTVEVGGEEHKAIAVMVRRFVKPDHEPVFPWNHWADALGINAWEFDQLDPAKAVPADAFTGVFALSDVELEAGHYWITFAMINTEPEDLVADYD